MANCLAQNEILHQVGKIVVDFSRGIKFNNDPQKNSWGDTGEKCPPSNTLNLALYINYFSHPIVYRSLSRCPSVQLSTGVHQDVHLATGLDRIYGARFAREYVRNLRAVPGRNHRNRCEKRLMI